MSRYFYVNIGLFALILLILIIQSIKNRPFYIETFAKKKKKKASKSKTKSTKSTKNTKSTKSKVKRLGGKAMTPVQKMKKIQSMFSKLASCTCPAGFKKTLIQKCYAPCPNGQVLRQGKCYNVEVGNATSTGIAIGSKKGKKSSSMKCDNGFKFDKKDNQCKKYTLVGDATSQDTTCPKNAALKLKTGSNKKTA